MEKNKKKTRVRRTSRRKSVKMRVQLLLAELLRTHMLELHSPDRSCRGGIIELT